MNKTENNITEDSALEICCAWCNVKLTTEAIDAFNGFMGCDSCGPEPAEVEIRCTNSKCTMYKRVIYSK
jgi:hypothetical protein